MNLSLCRPAAAFLFLSCTLALWGASPGQREEFKRGKWEDDIGYRQAVRVGNTVYISGCTAPGPMGKAVPQAYEALKKSLEHFGLGFEHVVKETIYTTDLDALKAQRELRKPFYKGQYPAATWVQISRLFQPEYVIEVELIAVIPDTVK